MGLHSWMVYFMENPAHIESHLDDLGVPWGTPMTWETTT